MLRLFTFRTGRHADLGQTITKRELLGLQRTRRYQNYF